MAQGLQLSVAAKNEAFFMSHFQCGRRYTLPLKKKKGKKSTKYNFYFVVGMAFFFCVGTKLTTMAMLNHDKVYCNTNSLQ